MTYHKKGGESDSDEHAHSCCFLVYPPELLSVFQPCGSDGSFVGFEPYPPRLKGCWKFIFHSFAGGYRQCLIFHPGSMTHRLHLEGKRDWLGRLMGKGQFSAIIETDKIRIRGLMCFDRGIHPRSADACGLAQLPKIINYPCPYGGLAVL